MRVSVPLRDAYRLLNHGPTTLVSTCEALGAKRNVMAAAWAMPVDFEPPKVAVVIASGTHTRELLDRNAELVLSLPTVAMLDQVYLVGTKSGREIDKWASLRTEEASRVRPPLISGCVGWLECVALPEEDLREKYDLVVAEVVAAWADDEVYRDREWRFEPADPRRTIHHLAHGTFFATGERLEAREAVKIGPYEALGVLGRGGMGVVHRGRSGTGEIVAIKILPRTDRETLARFEREQRLLGSFTARDGFVPLLDAGTSSECPYLVMPLLSGGTLRDRLERGSLGVEETLLLGRALAAALGRAHARGVVHRDVKPENILYTADGRPLVADLGLAKHFTTDAPGASQSVSLSRRGDIRGTVGYMSPEQVNDASAVGPRADVFALGAILYECLAGRPAFSGANLIELLSNVASGTREPLSRARPDVPRWLADVVERALADDPADQYSDGIEVGRALHGQAARRLRGPRARLATALAVVAMGGVVAAGAVAANARKAVSRPPAPPPAPRPEARGPRLPRGLRLGTKVSKPDGAEIQVYIFELPGNAGDMELVHVPAGDFVMGADDADALREEKPEHTHAMDHAYWIGRKDVTWRQYLAYCDAASAARPRRLEWAGDDHPVVTVSWDDATAYCAWAKLALPSEAEWEKAARGTDGRKYPWGNRWEPTRLNFADRNAPARYADSNGAAAADMTWRDMTADDGWAYTSPAGSYPEGVSPYGALDMAGDVWQWCETAYDPGAYQRYAGGDTGARADGSFRVARGGGWDSPARFCRTSLRAGYVPMAHYDNFGFRVVLRSAP